VFSHANTDREGPPARRQRSSQTASPIGFLRPKGRLAATPIWPNVVRWWPHLESTFPRSQSPASGGIATKRRRLSREWIVVVVGTHYAGALIAKDLSDSDRRFAPSGHVYIRSMHSSSKVTCSASTSAVAKSATVRQVQLVGRGGAPLALWESGRERDRCRWSRMLNLQGSDSRRSLGARGDIIFAGDIIVS
jgi:hypothetical protein